MSRGDCVFVTSRRRATSCTYSVIVMTFLFFSFDGRGVGDRRQNKRPRVKWGGGRRGGDTRNFLAQNENNALRVFAARDDDALGPDDQRPRPVPIVQQQYGRSYATGVGRQRLGPGKQLLAAAHSRRLLVVQHGRQHGLHFR